MGRLAAQRAAPPPCCAQAKGVQFILPTDVVVTQSFPGKDNPTPESKVVSVDAIPDGWMVS